MPACILCSSRFANAVPRISLRSIRATKERNSEAKRRQTQRSLGRACGPGRAPIGVRTSIGVPPRLWLRRPNATAQLQFRASRAGAFKRALPANRPATVQRCFSQTGRNAGRAEFPKTARERIASPPAGTALAPRYGLPATARPIDGRDSPYVTKPETNVNRSVTIISARFPAIPHLPLRPSRFDRIGLLKPSLNSSGCAYAAARIHCDFRVGTVGRHDDFVA